MLKRKYIYLFILVLGVLVLTSNSLTNTALAKSKYKTYEISPNSKPYKNNYTKLKTYNKNTKDYYLLLSYLKVLEKEGGGKLILKKGTYTISNTLFVSSNVTIVLNDGVVIKKGTKTGTNKFDASASIFQLIRHSWMGIKGKVSKYNGEKNITIIGKGDATIDLRYMDKSLAIVAGHNKNVRIENIIFKNLSTGHFIEADAVDGLKIINNQFINSKESEKLNREAINLDTPDLLTKGFNNIWSAHDKTPNKNVLIQNNYFYNLDRAVGTHKYSQIKDLDGKYTINMYHTNIRIVENIIVRMRSDAIRVLNWKNTVIEDNYIDDVGYGYRGVSASGAVNLCIRNNVFEGMCRSIQIYPAKNLNDGSVYRTTFNKLTKRNLTDMTKNTLIDVDEDFIRISEKLGNYSNCKKVYITN